MAGLWLLDFSLNTLTLFAMTLSIGIVVDDAIVVLENVERIMRTEGLGPYEASQKAMKEVSGALVAIVLVLSSVFIPVAFLGGIAGELYRQFAVTVAVSVMLSGFVALTLTPALCAIFLKPHDADAKRNFFFTKFNQGLASLTMRFLQLVRLALKHRLVTATILVLVTAGAWQMIQRIPTSFIPTEDQGIVRMALQLPEGAAFPRTEKVVDELYEKVRSNEAVRSVVTMVGFDTLSSDQRANAAGVVQRANAVRRKAAGADGHHHVVPTQARLFQIGLTLFIVVLRAFHGMAPRNVSSERYGFENTPPPVAITTARFVPSPGTPS